jgi:hypothetical protein
MSNGTEAPIGGAGGPIGGTDAPVGGGGSDPGAEGGDDTHTEHGDHPWTIQIPDHPKRTDSAAYVASRKRMNKLAKALPAFLYGEPPYHDHHGGGLWLKDESGWFLVRNLVGIEWSAQFCADPAKVDLLRQNARRVYAAFPEAVEELGIRALLDTPITDPEGVARWTDSICNASVPLPQPVHVGVLPNASTGGVHHYPTPIAEIELIKRDDFVLWVSTAEGGVVALVPVAARGSGDGRTRLLLAAVPPPEGEETPIARLAGAPPADERLRTAPGLGEPEPTILAADNPLSRLAFARQT